METGRTQNIPKETAQHEFTFMRGDRTAWPGGRKEPCHFETRLMSCMSTGTVGPALKKTPTSLARFVYGRFTGPAGAIKPQGQSAQVQGTPEFLSLKCHGGASAGR